MYMCVYANAMQIIWIHIIGQAVSEQGEIPEEQSTMVCGYMDSGFR